MSVVKDRLDFYKLQQRDIDSAQSVANLVVVNMKFCRRLIFLLISRRKKYNKKDKTAAVLSSIICYSLPKKYGRRLRDTFNPMTLRHFSPRQNNEQCPIKILTIGIEIGRFQGSHEGVPPPQSLRHDLVYVLHAHHPFLQSVQMV